jgi:hypothetical protein
MGLLVALTAILGVYLRALTIQILLALLAAGSSHAATFTEDFASLSVGTTSGPLSIWPTTWSSRSDFALGVVIGEDTQGKYVATHPTAIFSELNAAFDIPVIRVWAILEGSDPQLRIEFYDQNNQNITEVLVSDNALSEIPSGEPGNISFAAPAGTTISRLGFKNNAVSAPRVYYLGFQIVPEPSTALSFSPSASQGLRRGGGGANWLIGKSRRLPGLQGHALPFHGL